MNGLDGLLKRLAPNGVRFLKLGELEDLKLVKLGRGDVISKMDLNANPGSFPVYSSSATSNGLFGSYGKYMFEDERITWSIDGGGKFFYREPHKYSVTNVCGWLTVLDKDQVNTRYLYFVLIAAWGRRTYNYTVKAHPSVIREDYVIPLPPLEVQVEIVRILETFTELQAELEAEQLARTLQYEHYRHRLLSCEGVESREVELGSFGKVLMCKRIMKDETSTQGDVPFFKIGTFGGEADAYITLEKFEEFKAKFSFPKVGSLLISAAGTIGKIVRYNGEPSYFQDSNIVWLDHDESVVLNDYLFHCYKIAKWSTDTGSIPRLYNSNILKLKIKVPAIAEQRRIAGFLGKFETLTNDPVAGLLGEIQARRQQYNFYRNELLTFNKSEVG